MADNTSMLNGEHSFFEDRSYSLDPSKNQKEITKNSSNPEKTYEILNSEIKKVTANVKDLSELSNSTSIHYNESLIDMKIWDRDKEDKDNTTLHQQETAYKYYDKFEALKKKSLMTKKKADIPISPHDANDSSSEIEIKEEMLDDNMAYNNMNTLFSPIKSMPKPTMNPSKLFQSSFEENNGNVSFKCITEPNQRNIIRPLFSESNIQYNSNNSNPKANLGMTDMRYSNPFNYNPHTPMQSFLAFSNRNSNSIGNLNNKNSFHSTQYSSNRVFLSNNNNNSNEDCINFDDSSEASNNNYNSCIPDYKARVPTNESAESNHSLKYNKSIELNMNRPLFISSNNSNNKGIDTSVNEDMGPNRKFNSSTICSINEGYLNAFKKKKMLYCDNKLNYMTTNNVVKSKKGSSLVFKPDTNVNNGSTVNSNQSNANPSNTLSVLKGEKQLINLDNIATGKDTRTTVMIRNIPIKYTDKMLLKELISFEGKYDCLYMPYDFEKGGNKGYAFINFTHSYHILFFHMKFQNKSWEFFESKKICELNSAKFQGIAEIQKHANNYKGLKKPSFFPVFDPLANLEIPIKYLCKIKLCYPKMTYIEKKPLGLFVIKSLR